MGSDLVRGRLVWGYRNDVTSTLFRDHFGIASKVIVNSNELMLGTYAGGERNVTVPTG